MSPRKNFRVVTEIAKRRTASAANLEVREEDVISGIRSAVKMPREQQNPAMMFNG